MGYTIAGMDWNGMDYWNGLKGSNSQLLFISLVCIILTLFFRFIKIHLSNIL